MFFIAFKHEVDISFPYFLSAEALLVLHYFKIIQEPDLDWLYCCKLARTKDFNLPTLPPETNNIDALSIIIEMPSEIIRFLKI